LSAAFDLSTDCSAHLGNAGPAACMQVNRMMKFTEAYDGWSEGRLTQAVARL